MENLNHKVRTNMLDFLRSTNQIRIVDGEELMTPVAMLFAFSTVSRSRKHEDQKKAVSARRHIHHVMEATEQAGYKHAKMLEAMLCYGTPTKHFVGSRIFCDGDELELIAAMCGEALSLLPAGAFEQALAWGKANATM